MLCAKTGKYIFETLEDALTEVASSKVLNHDTLERAYRCTACSRWHTTSKPYRPSKYICHRPNKKRFKFKTEAGAMRHAWEVGRLEAPYRCKSCRHWHFDPDLRPPPRRGQTNAA